ncbi:prepilin-type N-terminal cleavage/methylation domain-containing protein [Vibrio sp. HN007]|uniref:prepilin-type N-terminal cleavage/methylation domain-containing protein n=1 Tax=Vibrio iocasae TaxID=3098914 RepID=UPI0035D47B3A
MKARGFTLIEMVVVIVVLGILAVTAAPKFLNLQDDSNEVVIKGVKGAAVSGVSLFHSRWLLDGEPVPTTSWGDKISELHYNKFGYPRIIGSLQECDTILKNLINNQDYGEEDYSYSIAGSGEGNQCIYTFLKASYEMRYVEQTGEITLSKT